LNYFPAKLEIVIYKLNFQKQMANKSKVEVPKYIASKTQRNIAFCKRKRAFLKKAIELSVSCDQQMLVMIFDKTRNRLI